MVGLVSRQLSGEGIKEGGMERKQDCGGWPGHSESLIGTSLPEFAVQHLPPPPPTHTHAHTNGSKK